MTPEFVIQILRQTLMMAFWLAAPLLAVGFVVGIAISLVQTCTKGGLVSKITAQFDYF